MRQKLFSRRQFSRGRRFDLSCAEELTVQDRLKILDIWVDPVDRRQALDRVRGFLQGNRPCSIFAVNPEKNFSAAKDPVLYKTFEQADLLVPDGIGIVMAAKLLHGVSLRRVPGVDLMRDICQLAAEEAKSVFFYGASESVSQTAVEKLQIVFPKMRIAGRSNGYVQPSKIPELIKRINDSGAEILFLALGSPKQERWFAAHAAALSTVKICQGIGGTLDTIAGTVKRAPVIWQRLSLEWLYRLLSEPRRIHRQKALPVFALKVIKCKVF
jgi:N-acetylglucosaminyldiphosphoundecaprenol N-acetyl-beta-D-mannosaminyltransferase